MRMREGSCAIVLAATLGSLGPAAVAGQTAPAQAETAAARSLDPVRVLANVVHLSDNDLRFRTSTGVRVFVDPLAGPADPVAKARGMTAPDLVLITHPHLDHYNVVVLREYARLNPLLALAGPADVARYARASGVTVTEVRPGQDYTMAGLRVRTLPAWVVDEVPHPRENGWVGYLFDIDGVACYVTGDTQPLPEMAELEVDVLFPPVFGCGSNVEQALATVAACRPRVVVPVHTGGQQEVIDAFLARLPQGVRGAWYKDGKLVVPPRTGTKHR